MLPVIIRSQKGIQTMTDRRNGRRFAVPANRRLTWDLLTFHREIPLCAHDRHMDLTAISAARTECPQRISWPALFIKAYALVAQEIPELRQTWYVWPWARQISMSHDSYLCRFYPNTRPFPTKRKPGQLIILKIMLFTSNQRFIDF